MEEECVTQFINLETWMSDLPDRLKEIPFIYLAIPGSHDAMSYGITRSSDLAPDAEPILHKLFPLFRGTLLRWTVTQGVDTLQQLKLGIRYFDMRLATKTGNYNFYFTHGLYAKEIDQALTIIKEFIEDHPGELVILDFQHFYGFTLQDHRRLKEMLLNLYGHKLVSRQMETKELTLNNLTSLKQQVVLIYRHDSVYSTSYFWTSRMFPNPWPRQDTTVGLIYFLRNVTRAPDKGFVHQTVLTPTANFIMWRWYSSLLKKCARPVVKEVLPIMSEFSPGTPLNNLGALAPVNVVMADYIELEDAQFPKTIISLNFKLLQTLISDRTTKNALFTWIDRSGFEMADITY